MKTHVPASISFQFSARRGFSLVELLTVIAVIGILAGILIPVVGRVRDSAKTSACSSNLRQLGMAAQLYSADNRGRLLPIFEGTSSALGRSWRVLVADYLGETISKDAVFSCPADPFGGYLETTRGLLPASYGVNPITATPTFHAASLHDYVTEGRGARTSAIVKPARTIFITDLGRPSNQGQAPSEWNEDGRSASSGSFGYARFPHGASFTSGDPWNVYPRHGGGRKTNAVFHDGHVETLDFEKDILAHAPNSAACLYDNN